MSPRRTSKARVKGPARERWTPVSAPAVEALANATSHPGVVFPVGTTALPSALEKMPGAVSYFVSGYMSPLPVAQGITAGGEMVVVRTDSDLGKAYNYVFATSADGQVCFNGPHKYFAGHHFPASSAVVVSSLFGHRFSNK